MIDAAVLASALRLATPLMFAALGGIVSERAGVINIALEAKLLAGAFAAAAVAIATGSAELAVAAAAGAGATVGLMHGVFGVVLRGDQIVVGVALNLFVAGATQFLMKLLYGSSANTPTFSAELGGAFNPLIVLAIMGALGYRKRTGFLAGLTVAQISEFSLIFMTMGVTIGHVAEEALGLVTLVGLVTIAASTYMITFSHQLYAVFEPVLGIFERRHPGAEPDNGPETDRPHDIILLGLGRYGLGIAVALRDAGKRILGVDFSPDAVRYARTQGFDVLFGDATDPELLAHLPLRNAACWSWPCPSTTPA